MLASLTRPEPQQGGRMRVAVVGSGIAGLSAAWLLARRHEVTLLEKDGRLGGHTNTVNLTTPDGTGLAVDTGFIVFNEAAYPNLTALFAHLGVATRPTDMSFGVSLDGGRYEYSGGRLLGLFAQPANLVSRHHWSLLSDVVRFYRTAPAMIARYGGRDSTLGEFMAEEGYGEAFIEDHLLPMAGAIWSAEPRQLRDYPAASFIRFFENHGLLRLLQRPRWRTVSGGSKRYIDRMMQGFPGHAKLATPVTGIVRTETDVIVSGHGGQIGRFDHVVLATHADQALSMLRDATSAEQQLLGAFRYTSNRAILHGDTRLMPRRRAAWSSWNYMAEPGTASETAPRHCVTYWMNSLQGLECPAPVFVTLNPERLREPQGFMHEERYEHPLFDEKAYAAQQRLWSLQGHRRTWFCGAYFGAGFHEDALQAGLAVAEQLGGVPRPWSVANPSGRIVDKAAGDLKRPLPVSA